MLFLLIYANTLSLMCIYLSQLTTELKIMDSMKAVNQQISFEAKLINEVNCFLRNKEDVQSITEIEGVPVFITDYGDTIEVEMIDGKIITLNINEDRQVIVLSIN